MVICIGRRVAYEYLNLLWCSQDSSEIKRYPTNERRLVSFRRRLKTFLLQLCKDEIVNRVLRRGVTTSIVGDSRSTRYLESPMRAVHSALLDPFLENGDFVCAHRLGLALRTLRHQVFRIFGLNTFD